MKYILYLFLILTTKVWAIELSELERLAIENSSQLKAEEMEERALRSEKEVSGRWQNPQLMGQFGSISSDGESGSTIEMSLTQAIPLTKKSGLKKEMAEIALLMQRARLDYFKRWVSHQVILAAWRVAVKHELYLHGSERARRFSLIKRYLETSPRVSTKQKVELSIISSQLLQLEKDQDLKKYEMNVALNDLEFWVGKKIEAKELKLQVPKNYYEVSDAIDLARNLELEQSKNQLKVSKADLQLARNERIPDLYFGGGYRVENITPANHFRYAIVGINIPIWDSGSNRLESARARENKDSSKLTQMEKDLLLKQKNQIELIKMSNEQLKRFSIKLIDKSESIVVEAEKGFRQGVLDVSTFLQAENQSHEIVDQVYFSWINYLEHLSPLQLMRSENLQWESR